MLTPDYDPADIDRENDDIDREAEEYRNDAGAEEYWSHSNYSAY